MPKPTKSKFKTLAEEVAFYRSRNAAGGKARAERMTSAQRSKSAKYARSFAPGGSRHVAGVKQARKGRPSETSHDAGRGTEGRSL